MTYILDKTNNISTKIEVDNGIIDTNSTPLTLIGQGYQGWGEAVNENFLALLEMLQQELADIQIGMGYNNFWLETKVKKFEI